MTYIGVLIHKLIQVRQLWLLAYYFLLRLLAHSNQHSKHTTMASSVQTDIDLFLRDQENKNTSLKTKRDVRYISRYFLSLGESQFVTTNNVTEVA